MAGCFFHQSGFASSRMVLNSEKHFSDYVAGENALATQTAGNGVEAVSGTVKIGSDAAVSVTYYKMTVNGKTVISYKAD